MERLAALEINSAPVPYQSLGIFRIFRQRLFAAAQSAFQRLPVATEPGEEIVAHLQVESLLRRRRAQRHQKREYEGQQAGDRDGEFSSGHSSRRYLPARHQSNPAPLFSLAVFGEYDGVAGEFRNAAGYRGQTYSQWKQPHRGGVVLAGSRKHYGRQ